MPSSIEFRSYSENDAYLTEGKPEPNVRSQMLIYHSDNSKWWVKVTFKGEISQGLEQRTPKRERRREFQNFVKDVDYSSLPLLDDTVTEVLLEELSEPQYATLTLRETEGLGSGPFARLARTLRYTTREDPSRVIYPSCREFTSFPHINMAELSDEVMITAGVSKVFNIQNKTPYILKVVNRPLYYPYDTEVIRRELENLQICKGVPNIVQAAGIAVSKNPYMTSSTSNQPLVVIGILLEFHSGGSLQEVLSEGCLLDHPWERWAIQIATALAHLHGAGVTHMDIKPSNVVLDSDGNAILIDISGIGGVTYEWCAPEIRDEISPIALPFEVRRLCDIWAYGHLLTEIVSHAEDSPVATTLRQIADCLTGENTGSRMTLLEAISQLEAAGIGSCVTCN
ncbi:protein kinase family protein [Aspergillus fischeri NRRL 181]|uniref:Protein kinase, putative n=1 Tax=Neosartorya fischeri (strain ATCC 1020 / DSM 3700 / CBS 544.65 / FGSC A1164 / JCM 1740 / NRRL 181 / WB 181) TaxID=331117 RepID=A1DBW4_NEOFI|nr:protein kinase, putative [Aspergillus fischeri NRRL 181]EAW20354.1 protein kinase, putative [Aspergillus fischeri NRRL 181]